MKPVLAISEIADQYIRKNFERLRDFILQETPLQGFRAFSIRFEAPVINFKFKHGLGFAPKDLIQTSLIGQGGVQWNYSNFTATELDLTVSGAVSSTAPTTVRFLVGTLEVP